MNKPAKKPTRNSKSVIDSYRSLGYAPQAIGRRGDETIGPDEEAKPDRVPIGTSMFAAANFRTDWNEEADREYKAWAAQLNA